MSSIASFTARRALVARPALLSRAAPVRRFASASKAEESNLPKAGKRDPELYVCCNYTRRGAQLENTGG
jgi:hypothetical protein